MKIFTGKVIFTKDENTAKVAVDRVIVHPIYKKRYTKTKNYAVHNDMSANVGDVVRFVASKPYSKTKKWKIIEVVSGKTDKKLKVKKVKTKKGDKAKAKK